MDFFDTSFWQNFVSNALATFVGAVVGIPIALWLNRHQEKSSEKERKEKILRLLQEELTINLGHLSEWNKTRHKERYANIIGPFLRDESWMGFSDGGELEWIKDPALLSELANAYSYIRLLQQLTERYFNLVHLSYQGNVDNITINNLWEMVDKGFVESADMVSSALKAINNAK